MGMKIGIISDSHENLRMIGRAVGIFNSEGVGIVFHAGDIISPIMFKELRNLKAKVYAVFGNNDGERLILRERFNEMGWVISDGPFEVDVEGKKFLLMHQPFNLDAIIKSQVYDVIIYGHTHKLDIRREGGTLILNPGESGGWLYEKYTILILSPPYVEARVIDLKSGTNR